MSVTLEITQGLPASGKSTYALKKVEAASPKHPWTRVNRDALRVMAHGKPWDPKREKGIKPLRDAAIRTALKMGLNVINDDTNLFNIKDLEDIAAECRATFVVNDWFLKNVSVEECVRRDALREKSVGKDVIEGFYYDYWKTQDKPANEGSNAIICDIDGTLAHTDIPYPRAHDRDYLTDKVDESVRDLLRSVQGSREIIIVTGRKAKDHAATTEWMANHSVPYSFMLGRADGDNRDDAEVKKEIYLRDLQGKFKINYVIDDRPRVVRMWRAELGLKVLQAMPNLEF